MRPQKKGLVYFPHDVTMSEDSKIEFLEAVCGLQGYAIFLKILERIYREEGYYVEWNERDSAIFAKRNGVEVNAVKTVVNVCIKEGLFNKNLYEKHHILTSERIQKTYLQIAGRRKDVKLNGVFVCIVLTETGLAYTQTGDTVTFNPVNVAESTQRKEKKRKEYTPPISPPGGTRKKRSPKYAHDLPPGEESPPATREEKLSLLEEIESRGAKGVDLTLLLRRFQLRDELFPDPSPPWIKDEIKALEGMIQGNSMEIFKRSAIERRIRILNKRIQQREKSA